MRLPVYAGADLCLCLCVRSHALLPPSELPRLLLLLLLLPLLLLWRLLLLLPLPPPPPLLLLLCTWPSPAPTSHMQTCKRTMTAQENKHSANRPVFQHVSKDLFFLSAKVPLPSYNQVRASNGRVTQPSPAYVARRESCVANRPCALPLLLLLLSDAAY